ncbi:zf-C2HC5-domain-containing protein [Aspergillus steynii IBT 23096]|uniref:Zf-C2HC5-domain-containing protein n=1 Tax=Aspergillus steynii IBT 23096 TaxID=1392250 RepID=A0A2I2G8J8_9EURO|nr:zf-C2HC5-domain-containing protein [Aspergillus steynii IBT 23096]PLB49188.1 zf-C2HC5-domain-containing protein [Aspergillus steynii IBT 23096]
MADSSLLTWGVPRLSQILPLDEESLKQILSYAASLSKDEGAEHLKNLLGDSPAAFEFISSFSARKEPPSSQRARNADSGPPSRTSSPAGTATPGKKGKKSKPPLHSAGPVRQVENFGNVAGGYRKADQEEDYMAAFSGGRAQGKDTKGAEVRPSAQFLGPSSREDSSASSSRAPSPAPKSGAASSSKAPPSASGPVISDYLPNVKSKAAKTSSASSSRQGGGGSSKGALTTSNISDLTAAIAALEVSTNPTLGGESQKCNCNASLHPLFDPAPNCLNCGKIICSLEGLQPCSFCGTPLLSSEEIQGMIRELRAERGQEKMRAHNEGVHREGGPGPGNAGSNKLDAAKAHRDRLLQFQAQNAKRTKVVDEAADFETPNVASTLWMSPAQRALALKKQQRVLREMEERARPEWEKKQTVMSLDIKGGKLTRVYQSAGPAESSPSAEEQAEQALVEEALSHGTGRTGSGEAFSHNPLLAAGGLVRPVWKGADGKQVESTARKDRKQTWRRVQDDNDDNEQWILDGGAHGYTG